jgi:hypothetical protein
MESAMTAPMFWRDLRDEFHALPDPEWIDTSAPRRLKAVGGEIVGGTASLRFQFTQLAKRGGIALGASRATAVATWLRRLRADLTHAQNPSLSDMRITTTKPPTSTRRAQIVTVTEYAIDHVSAASVDSCIALETQARPRKRAKRRATPGASTTARHAETTAFDLNRYDLKTSKNRADAVTSFLRTANMAGHTERRITQSDFWRVAGYKNRYAYYAWKGNKPSASIEATAIFRAILALSPSLFIKKVNKQRASADF